MMRSARGARLRGRRRPSAGCSTDMGLNRYFAALPLASAYGAVIAASATALALQARERSGVGDHIKVPLI